MRCIRPGGAAAEESHTEKTTPCIAGGGLLAAIAAVLQFVGSAIRFGPFSISLVLIPIVLGAALYGWGWYSVPWCFCRGMPASFWRQIREGPL